MTNPFKPGPILGLVTARGGSKRLPRKNLLPFPYGDDVWRPSLTLHAVNHGLHSPSITHVVLSSDDDEILAECRKYAPDAVALKRPDYLATDKATSDDVIDHVVDHYAQQGMHFTWVVLLQPTSPLRTPLDIELTLQLAKAGTVSGGGYPALTVNAATGERNGAVYVATPAQLREKPTMGDPWSWEATKKHPMPPERSVDVDTLEQLQLASWIAGQLPWSAYGE